MKRKLAAALAILLIAAPQAAFALPVVWTLNGVTFADGGTASGSFTYDADFNTYSNISITTTPGITRPAGAVYTQMSNDFAHTSTYFYALTAAGSVTGAPTFVIPYYATPLTNAGGNATLTVAINAEGTCTNTPCTNASSGLRAISGGTLTGVAVTPVPTLTEWGMMLLGIILAGAAAVMIQRRRFAAWPTGA